jgi:hypothetical protein
MPVYRQIATRLHSLIARRWVTESTDGFRAVRTRVFADLTKLEAQEKTTPEKK